MGNRATIQLVDNENNFSPVVYLHWAGERALDNIQRTASIMRAGDISYAFARLVGALHLDTQPDQGLSLGVYNATEVQESDEHGDNGHFKVNINSGEVTHYGGYEPEQGAVIPNIVFGKF